jgi:serine protease Do
MRTSIPLIALMGATALIGQSKPVSEDDFFLMNDVRMPGSYLGVTLADMDADRAKRLRLDEPKGVEVTRVEEASPAAKAGIKPGDVLLAYNGENILGAQQLGRLVSETPEGRKIRLQIWRDGRTQTLTVITEARRGPSFDLRRGVHFDMPEFRNIPIPDIPNPMLMWKISALGIECEPVDSQLAEYFGVKRGLLVRSVAKGSPAEKAGLKAGDVLTSIGDKPVTSSHDVTGFLRMQRQPNTPISVVVVRDHKQLTMNVVPSEYPK